MKIKAVIFDLFETLVDFSLDQYNQVLKSMADCIGKDPDQFVSSWHDQWARHENGEFAHTTEYVEAVAGAGVSGADLAAAVAIHGAFQQQVLTPHPETIRVLSILKEAEYRIGVVTNCPIEAPALWSQTPLSSWVDVAVFSSIERVRKPDPAIFLSCLERLGCVPAECLYVGDGANQELVATSSLGLSTVQLKIGPKEKDIGIYQSPVISQLSGMLLIGY